MMKRKRHKGSYNGSAKSVIYTVPEVQFVFSEDISIKFLYGNEVFMTRLADDRNVI